MITRCGLNRLNAFGSWLAMHLRNSRQDAKLLSLLVNLDDVLYSGLALPQDEEKWAFKNGIKLRVSQVLDPLLSTLYLLPFSESIRKH